MLEQELELRKQLTDAQSRIVELEQRIADRDKQIVELNRIQRIAADKIVEIKQSIGYKEATHHTGKQADIFRVVTTLRDTLIAKNRDYGDSAFQPPVLAPDLPADSAVRVRMSDKIARIIQLSSSQREDGPAVKNESLIDSYLDLAGYAILQTINLESVTDKANS